MRTRCDRTSTAELKRLLEQLLDGRALSIGRRAQRDEPRLLSGALEEAAAIVELAAAVEEEGRVPRKRADPDNGRTVDRVAHDLPHVRARSRRLALITDLVRRWGDHLHRSAGRLHDPTHARWDLLDVFRNGNPVGGRHVLASLRQLLDRPLVAVRGAEVHEPAP